MERIESQNSPLKDSFIHKQDKKFSHRNKQLARNKPLVELAALVFSVACSRARESFARSDLASSNIPPFGIWTRNI